MNASTNGNAASIFTTSGGAMRKFRHEAPGRDDRREHRRRGADGLLPVHRLEGVVLRRPARARAATAIEFYTEKKVVITRWPEA